MFCQDSLPVFKAPEFLTLWKVKGPEQEPEVSGGGPFILNVQCSLYVSVCLCMRNCPWKHGKKIITIQKYFMLILHIYLATDMKSFNGKEVSRKFLWAGRAGIWNWVVTSPNKLTVANSIILEFCYIWFYFHIPCCILKPTFLIVLIS